MADVRAGAERAPTIARGDWGAAYATWSAVDARRALGRASSRTLPSAAELTRAPRRRRSATLQRAFPGTCSRADLSSLAPCGCAFRLAMTAATCTGRLLMAGGWTSRAEGLVVGASTTCVERGLGRVPADVPRPGHWATYAEAVGGLRRRRHRDRPAPPATPT